MSLSSGTRLGSYEVTAAIGAGGMGEVYRATDTRLGRDVAIKVLPKAFAADPERVARFEREAKLLASLNHTNIAHVYGFEKATLPDGATVHFLAMELVPGEDLAERMARGAIAVEEAIPIAKQIAEALEEAHEKGIVHRDLKPANVKLTADGKVKVLDFGLAKAWEGEGGGSSPDLSQSPTLARGTQAGLILGTAAYMSPEQARGKPVDKRADIWSFGVVVFEMLSGRRLFAGATVSDTLAAVLRDEIDWSALPASLSKELRQTLRRCLDRDPRRRLHDIADARIALEDALSGTDRDDAVAPPPAPPRRLRTASMAGVAAALFGLVVGAAIARRNVPAATDHAHPVVRFEVAFPADSRFLGEVALSPDGQRLVYSAGAADGSRGLWLRPLDAIAARPIAGTTDARLPFWSPDGRQVGFFGEGHLRAIDLVSGAVRTLARTSTYTDVRGAAWSTDAIVFAPAYVGPLMRVPAGGGAAEPATRLVDGQGTHRHPRFLPDGRRFLFYASTGTGTEPGQMCLAQLDAPGHRCFAEASSAAIVIAHDTLMFVRGTAVLAQRFDAAAATLVGEPVAVGVDLPANLGTSGHRPLAMGAGTLAYQVGSTSNNRIVWIDRDGTEREVVYDQDFWIYGPTLSPDGRRVAFAVYRPGGQGELWVLDPARRNETRLTASDGVEDAQMVVWSPSGRELAILSQSAKGTALFRAEVDRPGSTRPWRSIPNVATLDSWLPGDAGVLYTAIDAVTRGDVWRLDTRAGAEPERVIATPASEHSAEASPDGRWVAYVSDVTGREEVYVQGLDRPSPPWKISRDGGNDPRFRADGKELFYMGRGGRLFAVPTEIGDAFTPGAPEFAFAAVTDQSSNRQYDVTPDGRRFVVTLQRKGADNPIVVVLGFAEEIRRRLAAGGGAP